MPGSNEELLFATSNKHKVAEVQQILSEFQLRVRPLDLKGTEIQSDDILAIAAYASRGASERARRPVFVEDAGLFIEALGGFPGPYSSYVFRKLGPEGVLHLLGDDVKNRWAFFRSALAYCEPGGEPAVFEGSIRGRIVAGPAGSEGFGFDPIFVPEGGAKTLAEMSLDEKCRISHRAISVRRFGAWFAKRGEKRF
jgi:XTP/dITP diphosphohydrolase